MVAYWQFSSLKVDYELKNVDFDLLNVKQIQNFFVTFSEYISNMDTKPILLDKDQLIAVLNLSKNPISIHTGEEAVIQYANEAMLAVWGKDSSIIGLPLEQAIPEMIGQPFKEMFAVSFREGKVYSGKETPADLVIDGKKNTYYFDFEYRPVRDALGNIFCVMNSAFDVTERVLHQQTIFLAKRDANALLQEQQANEKLAADNLALETQVLLRARQAVENAEQFKRLVTQAPVAIAVMSTQELFVDIANPKILEIWAKPSTILGLPLAKAMPELIGQP